MISMCNPSFTQHEEKYVVNALRCEAKGKPYYYCEKFEEEFAAFCNRKYGIMTPNCTSALHLLLRTLNINFQHQVLLPECTWIATIAPVIYTGARPFVCDIEPDSWTIDPKDVVQNLQPYTKAIIAVDLYGVPANYACLERIAQTHNLFLIEDAAEAVGSSLDGRVAGNFGIASVFSFHRTKTIACGEGGIIVTDDKQIYDRARFYRDHGRNPRKPYFNLEVTFKMMPFNVQAALALAQLHRVNELVGKKREIFSWYKGELKNLDIKFMLDTENRVNGCWCTTVVIGKDYERTKESIMYDMDKKGIPIRPFFYPLTSLPAFNMTVDHRCTNAGSCRVAYDVSKRGISLPSGFSMTRRNVKKVCDCLKETLK